MKQQEEQEKLKKLLVQHKTLDNAALQKGEERERIRRETHAEIQDGANVYIQEQIRLARE